MSSGLLHGTDAADVLADIDAHRTPPSSWYTDPAHFALERDRVLRRSWHFVTDVDRLPAAGDVLPVEVAGLPIVLVRGADGTIDGFVNICRHRAHPVAIEAGNRRSLTCRYHGWSYDLTGALRGVPQANGEVPFDVASVCLPKVQVATFGPTVWVNPDLDAPSFDVWVAGLDERLLADGCDVRACRRQSEHTWWIDCNWKVFQDNTIECYHCPTTHPEFSRAVVQDPARQRMEVGGRYWIHHTIPFRDDVPDGVTHGRVDGRPFDYHYTWIFPTTYLQHQGRGFDIGTIDVVGVDRLRFRHLWFGPADTTPEVAALAQKILEADVTIPQDVALCGRVQRSHASGAAPVGLLVPGREALLTHLYRLTAELLADGRP
jgi:choline monooxygenase